MPARGLVLSVVLAGIGVAASPGIRPRGIVSDYPAHESTAAFEVRTADAWHPAVQGLDWSVVPPILGFNETRPSPGGNIIVEIRNGTSWYPLLAERRIGSGRSTAWTAGASPHWGVNFMKWDHYDQFWAQLFTPTSGARNG